MGAVGGSKVVVKRERSLIVKCPRCGSKNIAEILYGMPAYYDEIQAKIDAGKLRLGGCCVSGADPKFYCNDCKKEFATPPVVINKDGFEDLRDMVTAIHFSDGGFFGGYQDIRFEKKNDVITLSVASFPSFDDVHHEVITEKEWRKLLDKLFCKLYVHEWKKRYVDPGILDGEQWELQFKLNGGRQRNYYGSNAYPPLWKELKGVFMPYFKKYGITINSNE